MEKNKEIVLPLKWGGQNILESGQITFHDVEFTADFGVFKKGEKYTNLNVDYRRGFIEYYGNTNCRIQEFDCIPRLTLSEIMVNLI